MWIGLAIVVGLQFYYVQEMIAAFVIFGVLFALVAGAVLLVFLLDRASERTLSWIETYALALLPTVRRGVSFLGARAAKHAGRAQVWLLSRTRLRHPRLRTAR